MYKVYVEGLDNDDWWKFEVSTLEREALMVHLQDGLNLPGTRLLTPDEAVTGIQETPCKHPLEMIQVRAGKKYCRACNAFLS